MQSFRVFLVDSHMTDEVLTPIRFFIRKRRGLNKYSYLTKNCSTKGKINITKSGALSGIIPASVFSILPKPLRSVIVYIETFVWAKLNQAKINRISPARNDVAIFFLRNHTAAVDAYTSMLRERGVIITWVTSHLHLSYANKNYIQAEDLVCLDNKLPESVEIRGNKIISPPVVNERFKVKGNRSVNKRACRVLCAGTIHMYQKPFLGSVISDGFHTMHPSRCSLLQVEDERIEKNFSVITDNINLYHSQRAYMDGDLPSMYNSFRFAFIGSESIGVAALGLYEAMSCGCEVFIESSVGEHVGLVEGVNAWFFDGTADSLLQKLTWILEENVFLKQELIEEFSLRYRADFLFNNLKKNIENTFE